MPLESARNTITYCLLEPGRCRALPAGLWAAAQPIIAAASDQAVRDFAKRVLEELADEYERHELHTAAVRKVVLSAAAPRQVK